ncbi:protein phosphatase, partial [Streptomyces sp. SID5785]|uniref:ATP-binding protein n=1 Tax=Streptomyces sp. SID5785 TaxID=2690309 RepID=UPI001360F7FC
MSDRPYDDGPDEVRTSLPGNPLAPAAARRFVRALFADRTAKAVPPVGDRLADDAVVVVSELVTNAVVHAGTGVDLVCRRDGPTADGPAGLVVEVTDHHPTRAVRTDRAARTPDIPEYGRGLQLVASLAEAWGITYRPGTKTVWARLPADGTESAEPAPQPAARPDRRGPRA